MRETSAQTKMLTPHFYYWGLVTAACLCLIATIVTGMLVGFVTADPVKLNPIYIRTLRPLHTLFSLSWIFLGIAGFTGLFCAKGKKAGLYLAVIQHFTYLLFLIWATASIVQQQFSGREYISWQAQISVPLVAAMLMTVLTVVRGWKRIVKHSTEAGWLLLLGTTLVIAGLVETHLYLLGNIALDPRRDLAIQWHGLDTFIAGWIISIYGIGMLLLPAKGKPLRLKWLYIIALIGITCDFGHHNYPSPQATYIKIIAFSATMLAIISFLRHLHSVRRKGNRGELIHDSLRQVEVWTLFAVSTGVLMAVPHLNRYIHGTYAVVGHTMGSMIGVNTFLLLAAVWAFAGVTGRWRYRLLTTSSVFLALFVVVFTGLGIARGILRTEQIFMTWIHQVRGYYILIPASGFLLSLALLALAIDATWLSFGKATAALPAPLPQEPSVGA
ncbi:MAG: cbb3-type cytochrome c oxidase subunit I [Verrucomicrobia bacterium]|nr:cbb3-type cytochrome c oxidase subunit I [Verrucomicrobiota bacterium]